MNQDQNPPEIGRSVAQWIKGLKQVELRLHKHFLKTMAYVFVMYLVSLILIINVSTPRNRIYALSAALKCPTFHIMYSV